MSRLAPQLLAAALAAALAASAGASAVQPDSAWSLRLPDQQQVTYRGVVNLDAAGSGPGTMMYPAPNVGGLIAAIITHAVLVESQKSAQKDKLQQAADAVLVPFQPIIERFTHRELMLGGLKQVRSGATRQLAEGEPMPAGWLVESTPVFSMTQDQRALVLNNLVSVFREGDRTNPAYQAKIRVVSAPRTGPDVQEAWKAGDGSALRGESAQLFAHSLELALQANIQPAGEAAPFRTVRYPQGEAEKIERAQLVARYCNRLVVRTLRGDLMSVPSESAVDAPATAACAPALPGWQ